MSKLPSWQFYPGDWRKDPCVQALDYETRGIWFEMLLLMFESDDRGKLLLNGRAMPEDALATILGLEVAKLQQIVSKLLSYGVASLCPDTGALMNRRMSRDEHLRKVRAEAGSLGGKQKASKNVANAKQKVTPSSSSSSSSSSSDMNKKDSSVIAAAPSDEARHSTLGVNGTAHASASTPPASPPPTAWPEHLQRIRDVLIELDVLGPLDDPKYWQAIDAWVESCGAEIFYLDELKGYVANQRSKTPGKKGWHKDLKAGFRNWLAQQKYWSERDAQRKTLKQRPGH